MDEEEDYTCDLSEEDLFDLTEKLLQNDENNCSQYFRYNLQERRCGEEDTCDEPLFSEVDQDALFEVPTIKTLMALHDNYIPVSIKKYFYRYLILHIGLYFWIFIMIHLGLHHRLWFEQDLQTIMHALAENIKSQSSVFFLKITIFYSTLFLPKISGIFLSSTQNQTMRAYPHLFKIVELKKTL